MKMIPKNVQTTLKKKILFPKERESTWHIISLSTHVKHLDNGSNIICFNGVITKKKWNYSYTRTIDLIILLLFLILRGSLGCLNEARWNRIFNEGNLRMLDCQPNVWRKEINNNTNQLIVTRQRSLCFPYALLGVLANIAIKNCVVVLSR